MAYLQDSTGIHHLESGVYAQRVEGKALVGRRQTLVTTKSYLRAHDLHWTGTQLLIATVEGPTGTPQPELGHAPVLRVHRFDASLTPLGAVITLAEVDTATPLRLVPHVRVRGDDQRLGVLSLGWREGTQETRVALAVIEGNEVIAVDSEVVSLEPSQPNIALAYSGEHFLRCSTTPATCQLIDAASARPLGRPIAFFSPLLQKPHDVLWLNNRFWVAAMTTTGNPMQRVLGWNESSGEHGLQVLLSREGGPTVFGYFIRYSLHNAGINTLIWMDHLDNYNLVDSSTNPGVLLRLTPHCP
ncbi:MAG: hypothetical protein JRH20_20020 [Deltaproteobacteria bacterium]|nr:hypothetical protein [Deltaproteobacteria bacterium]